MRFFAGLILLFFACTGHAQSITQPVSARYLGLFSYSANQADIFSARNNPATHAGLNQAAVGVYAERRFMLEDLNLYNVSIGLPTRSGNFGLHAGYFGFSQQNQSQVSLAYGRKISNALDVGASFFYHRLSQAGIYGNASAITGAVGLLYHASQKVHVGVNAYNPFRAGWGKSGEETLPSRYSFGLGYDATEKLFIGAEIIKEENQAVDVQAGCHYSFLPQFFVRAGIATQTKNYFAALGFQMPAFRVDLSASYHQQLGWSPGIVLLAKLGKAKFIETDKQ